MSLVLTKLCLEDSSGKTICPLLSPERLYHIASTLQLLESSSETIKIVMSFHTLRPNLILLGNMSIVLDYLVLIKWNVIVSFFRDSVCFHHGSMCTELLLVFLSYSLASVKFVMRDVIPHICNFVFSLFNVISHKEVFSFWIY